MEHFHFPLELDYLPAVYENVIQISGLLLVSLGVLVGAQFNSSGRKPDRL